MHFTAPHWPWEGPDDEAESKRIKTLWHYDGGSQKTYAAMVQSMDTNVGRVLQALDNHGQAANTIVVFTSDNGGERFAKTWPFSGMKEELLEGGLRIPVLVRWPGRVAAGSLSEQVVARRMKSFTAVLVVTSLVACSATGSGRYDKDAVTNAERHHDQVDCAKAAITAGGGVRRGFALFRIDRDAYERCMTDRGYTIRTPPT